MWSPTICQVLSQNDTAYADCGRKGVVDRCESLLCMSACNNSNNRAYGEQQQLNLYFTNTMRRCQTNGKCCYIHT